MTVPIRSWTPYGETETTVSAGRRTLVSAFSDLVRCRAGFQPYELPEIFAAPADEGENDACRRLVELDAMLITTQFVMAKITTYARPLGGGETVAIPAGHWEIDDPLPRFSAGLFNSPEWANAEAPASHRIFVDAMGFENWIAGLKPLGPLSNRVIEEALDPQLRAARAVTARRINQIALFEGQSEQEVASPVSLAAGETLDLLNIDEVCALVTKKRSTIYALVKEGQFPEPMKLGSSSRWPKREVLQWIREQAARRSNQ
jgi:excisionase family DNA binding protein